MNIALEKTEEYVDGELRRSYGDAFVRGNNGRPHLGNDWTMTKTLIADSPIYLCGLIKHHLL